MVQHLFPVPARIPLNKARIRRQLLQHAAAAQRGHRGAWHRHEQVQTGRARMRRHRHRRPRRVGVQHPLEPRRAAAAKVRLPNGPVKYPAGNEAVLGSRHTNDGTQPVLCTGGCLLQRNLQRGCCCIGAVRAESGQVGADGGGSVAQRRLCIACGYNSNCSQYARQLAFSTGQRYTTRNNRS